MFRFHNLLRAGMSVSCCCERKLFVLLPILKSPSLLGQAEDDPGQGQGSGTLRGMVFWHKSLASKHVSGVTIKPNRFLADLGECRNLRRNFSP